MAKAGLEMALWDLAGQDWQASHWPRCLEASGRKLEVGVSIGIQDEYRDCCSTVVRDHLNEGYRRVKLKIKPGMDLEYVQAVREASSRPALLQVDANAAYDTNQVQEFSRRWIDLGWR